MEGRRKKVINYQKYFQGNGESWEQLVSCLFKVLAALKPGALGLFSLDGNYESQEHEQSSLAAHQLGITFLAI